MLVSSPTKGFSNVGVGLRNKKFPGKLRIEFSKFSINAMKKFYQNLEINFLMSDKMSGEKDTSGE